MQRRRLESISHSRDSRTRFSQRGFTLVEIMITVVVASLGVMGMTALFSDMAKIQKKASTSQMLTSFRGAIVAAVISKNSVNTETDAWKLTTSDADATTGNPDLACLSANTACASGTSAGLNLKNSDGSELFYSRNASRGLTFDGRLCNTYSASTPDPSCPFHWNLTVTTTCTGATTSACANPIVAVEGILEYHAGPNDPLGSALNPNTYRISIRRGDKRDKNEPVIATYVMGTNSGELGSCLNTWYARQLNTIVSDPGSNIQALGSNSIELKTGTYECRVQAPAFKNGGNTVRFRNTTTNSDVAAASGFASLKGDSVTLTLQANFVISSATNTFQVLQRCTQQPSDAGFGSLNPNFMLGVPAPTTDYSSVTFTVVSCVKTSG